MKFIRPREDYKDMYLSFCKLYKVVDELDDVYLILDDEGDLCWFGKHRFVEVGLDEKIKSLEHEITKLKLELENIKNET